MPDPPQVPPRLRREIPGTFVARGVGVIAGGVTTILVARSLGPSQQGTFAASVDAIVVLAMLTTSTLPYTLMQRRRSGNLALSQALPTAYRLAVVLSLCAVPGLIGLTASTSVGGDGWLPLALLPLYLVFFSLDQIPSAAIRASGRAALAQWIDACESLLVLGLVVLAAMKGRLSVEVALTNFTFGAAGSLVAGHMTLRRIGVVRPPSGQREHVSTFAVGSWWLWVGQLSFFSLQRLDLIILYMLAGPSAAGMYSVAVKLGETILIVANSILTVSMGRSSVLPMDRVMSSTRAALKIAAVSTAASGGLLILASHEIVERVFGLEFLDAVTSLRVLVPGIVIIGSSTILVAELAVTGEVRRSSTPSLVALGVALFFWFLLIPSYGALGAALGSSIAYVVYGWLSVRIYLRTRDASWADLIR